MKQRSLSTFWFLSIAVVSFTFAMSSYSQGLGDVKQLCGNATAANKAMAKQAGYDLDALCSDVISITQTESCARNTESTPTNSGGRNSGGRNSGGAS